MLVTTNPKFNSPELLTSIFDHLCDAVYLLDPITSNVLWVNKVGYRVLGMDISEVLDHSVLSLQKNVVGDVQWQSIAEVIRKNQCYTFIGSHCRKDGTEFPVEVNTSVFNFEQQEYFLSIARDISKRRAYESETLGREKQILTAINASTDGLWDWDMTNDYVYMSESWKKMLGYGAGELEHHFNTWKHSIHPNDFARVIQALDEHLDGKRERYQSEYRLKNRNGHYIWVKDIGCISSYDQQGKPNRVTGLVTDITDYKKLEKGLLELAAYDELTGLRNRRECTKMFDQQLGQAIRTSSTLAIALFDLDLFKSVNDRYGHLAGDQVLKTISKLLSTNIRNSDFLFRWGGEEFLLLCPYTSLEEMELITNKLRVMIKEAITKFEQHEIIISASFGLACYPKDGKSQNELLLAADSALYKAKSQGRNCVCFINK